MRAVPGALDIADGDALALGARQPPNIGGADAVGGGIEIALRRLEEPRADGAAIDARRFRARRDIGLSGISGVSNDPAEKPCRARDFWGFLAMVVASSAARHTAILPRHSQRALT
jgi:hypothetical protein